MPGGMGARFKMRAASGLRWQGRIWDMSAQGHTCAVHEVNAACCLTSMGRRPVACGTTVGIANLCLAAGGVGPCTCKRSQDQDDGPAAGEKEWTGSYFGVYSNVSSPQPPPQPRRPVAYT